MRPQVVAQKYCIQPEPERFFMKCRKFPENDFLKQTEFKHRKKVGLMRLVVLLPLKPVISGHWKQFTPANPHPSQWFMLVSFIRSANKKKMSRMYHLGQNGAAVMLTKEQAEIATKEIQLNGLNIFASNLIPLDRRMQDLRNEDCKNVVYDQELPLASVIIIMYNEEPSLVLRTITSVLNASPRGMSKWAPYM